VTEKYADLAGLKEALEKKYKVKRSKPLPLLSHKFKRRSKSTRTVVGKKQSKRDSAIDESFGDGTEMAGSTISIFGESVWIEEGTLVWGVDYADVEIDS